MLMKALLVESFAQRMQVSNVDDNAK